MRREGLFSAEERAILRYTDLLTSFPGSVDSDELDDLGTYLNEEQVVELVMIVATANWTNRINDGLQTPLP